MRKINNSKKAVKASKGSNVSLNNKIEVLIENGRIQDEKFKQKEKQDNLKFFTNTVLSLIRIGLHIFRDDGDSNDV